VTFLTVSDDSTLDGYLYMFRFNISGLSRQEQPTSAQLHLHMMTSDQPAVINITIDQKELVWKQPEDTKNETEVKISLEYLLINNSQWTNDTLTIKVASKNPIILPTHHHYHPGLLLYMGGDPEAIDDLLATTLDKPTHSINDKKIEKRDIIKPCQLESFTVTFSQLGGGYQYIIQPKLLDIGQCVGKCPQYLGHSTEHAQVLNLLTFRAGSSVGSGIISPVSCTVKSFQPQPIVSYNPIAAMIGFEMLNELVATSCGCSHCSP